MKVLKIIIASICLIWSSNFYGQEVEAMDTIPSFNPYGVGVKGGFNYATVSRGSLAQNPDSRAGTYIGVNFEIPLVRNTFSIQPEVLFSSQGFERNYLVDDEIQKALYKFNYITIPVLAKFYVARGFSLEAGPQVGFLIGSDGIYLDEEGAKLGKPNDFDFGLAGSIAFQFEKGLFINCRYNRGLKEVLGNSDAKNSIIQIGLGFKFLTF